MALTKNHYKGQFNVFSVATLKQKLMMAQRELEELAKKSEAIKEIIREREEKGQS